jgi:serine/threonine protein kinase
VTDEIALTGLRLQERYWLDRPLGRGGLCAVYRGVDEVLNHRVAIKAVPPAQVTAYRAALHLTSTLAHPAAVMVLDAVVHQEWLFLIQEYVDGTSLTKRLESGLSIADALVMALQIASVLAYAHQHQIVHGDLTPAAVLIERDGGIRLNNFALPPDAVYFASLPETEAVLARALSLPVAAPDDGEPALATPAADIRAVGLLLWQALATAGQSGDRRDFRADVPAEVRQLVARAVVRSHPEQITTTDELVGALQSLNTSFAAMQQEEEQPTPPVLRRAREVAAQDPAWSREDTVITGHPWGVPPPPALPGPISGPRAAHILRDGDEAPPARPASPSGPLRRSAPSGPPSGPLRGPVPSGPLRAPRLSGPLPPYAPPSQPRSSRLTSPIPWSDDPEVARYAANPSGRTGRLGPPKSRPRPRVGLERRGFRVLPVVVVGVVLFIACFVAGYVMPLVLSLH